MIRRWLIIATVVVSLLLLVPFVGSAIWTNVGMLVLRNELLSHPHSSIDSYSIYRILNHEQVYRRMQRLYYILTLGGNRFSARSTMGRLALASGDTQTAADILSPLIEQAKYRPFVYQDIVTALSYAKKEKRVAGLCEMVPPSLRTQATSDMVAMACLSSRTGDNPGHMEALEGLVMWRPGDLYANYFLWREARRSGDSTAADAYRTRLVYFPLEAIHPTDERLLDYACEVIPSLLDEKLWYRTKATNVVSFLVWQYNDLEAVEQLLKQLIEQYPIEPDWLFYLGELYHRRSDWDRAEDAYSRVLEIDPTYVQVYLRLGMVAEAQSSNPVSLDRLVQAADWYEQYHQMAPNDLLGFERMVETYEALGRAEAVRLRRELNVRMDDRYFVAELLGVSVESVELGPNLVENGSFDAWETIGPTGWSMKTYLGQSGDQGLYFAGRDGLIADGGVARIITLWGGAMPDGTMTYAEYIGQAFPITRARYLVSIYYCAHHFVEGSGLLFLGDYMDSGGLRSVHQSLPDSGGQWQMLHTLVEGPSAPTSVLLLVRNLGIGDIYVGALRVKQISYEH